MVGFIAHLFLSLGVLAVIVLRVREPELPRPFRVPGYPVTPMLFLLVSMWYLANLLQTRLALSAIGIGICAAGLPLYVMWQRRATEGEGDV